LAVADLVGLVIAFAIAENVYGPPAATLGHHDAVARITEYLFFVLSLPVWLVLAKLFGLYNRDEERADHSTSDDLTRVFHLVTFVVWLLFAVVVLTRVIAPEPEKLLLFWAAAVVLVVAGRATARTICRRRIEYLQNTIVVGAGDVGQMIAKKLLNHPEYGINVVGLVDAEPRKRHRGLQHLALLGPMTDLTRIVRVLDVERVMFAFSNEPDADVLERIDELRGMGVQVDIVPRFFESIGPNVQVHTIEGVPLVGLPPTHLSSSSLLVKRLLDVAVSAAGLVALAPLLAAICVLLRVTSRGPVLYGSARVGRRGRHFVAYKFRTMRLNARDELKTMLSDPVVRAEFARTHKVPNDPRVTRVGMFLRKTSLDELPQLLNVLRGDISLVGPRPITATEYELMDADERAAAYWSISDLRPGLTGYWQINGRSGLDYSDRVWLDSTYLSGWSIGLDLTIIARTFRVVLAGRGAR
jgi:exopolysaccharide biosynthesis polyprenyl glycosylphosphotransferase